MATSLCRSTVAFTTLMVLAGAPGAARAQTSIGDARAQVSEWRPDLIGKYESGGGQNLPNNLFDGPYGKRSAGGVCQMLTRNWLRVAPMIDIDTVKFPVAGTATEFDQWRACWKLWTLDGYSAWTCCNTKLRQALQGTEAISSPPTAARRESASPPPTKEKAVAHPKNLAEVFFDRLSAPSDVYHAVAISLR